MTTAPSAQIMTTGTLRTSLASLGGVAAIVCSLVAVCLVGFQVVSSAVIEAVRWQIPDAPLDDVARTQHYLEYFTNHNLMWAVVGAGPEMRLVGTPLAIFLHVVAWIFCIGAPANRTKVDRLFALNAILFAISLLFLGTAGWILAIDI